MSRALDVQFLGSALVIGTFAAAEGSARLLDAHPGWPLAWYLNLEVFGSFSQARLAGSALETLFRPAAMEATATAFAILVLFRVVRFRFGLALAANISFLAVLFLISADLKSTPGGARAASFMPMASSSPGNDLTIVTLLCSSSAACLASHVSFLRAVASEAVRPAAPTGLGA
jgi:hypothetical protein